MKFSPGQRVIANQTWNAVIVGDKATVIAPHEYVDDAMFVKLDERVGRRGSIQINFDKYAVYAYVFRAYGPEQTEGWRAFVPAEVEVLAEREVTRV